MDSVLVVLLKLAMVIGVALVLPRIVVSEDGPLLLIERIRNALWIGPKEFPIPLIKQWLGPMVRCEICASTNIALLASMVAAMMGAGLFYGAALFVANLATFIAIALLAVGAKKWISIPYLVMTVWTIGVFALISPRFQALLVFQGFLFWVGLALAWIIGPRSVWVGPRNK